MGSWGEKTTTLYLSLSLSLSLLCLPGTLFIYVSSNASISCSVSLSLYPPSGEAGDLHAWGRAVGWEELAAALSVDRNDRPAEGTHTHTHTHTRTQTNTHTHILLDAGGRERQKPLWIFYPV